MERAQLLRETKKGERPRKDFSSERARALDQARTGARDLFEQVAFPDTLGERGALFLASQVWALVDEVEAIGKVSEVVNRELKKLATHHPETARLLTHPFIELRYLCAAIKPQTELVALWRELGAEPELKAASLRLQNLKRRLELSQSALVKVLREDIQRERERREQRSRWGQVGKNKAQPRPQPGLERRAIAQYGRRLTETIIALVPRELMRLGLSTQLQPLFEHDFLGRGGPDPAA
jgi:hypothetical protein